MIRRQDRFANLSTDELQQREQEALKEWLIIEAALKDRILAEAKVKIGKAYKITGTEFQSYNGRIIAVRYLRAERGWRISNDEIILIAEGGLKRTSSLKRPDGTPFSYGYYNGRYTSKHVTLQAERLDLSSEAEP